VPNVPVHSLALRIGDVDVVPFGFTEEEVASRSRRDLLLGMGSIQIRSEKGYLISSLLLSFQLLSKTAALGP
jgi:hypothetical protein